MSFHGLFFRLVIAWGARFSLPKALIIRGAICISFLNCVLLPCALDRIGSGSVLGITILVIVAEDPQAIRVDPSFLGVRPATMNHDVQDER